MAENPGSKPQGEKRSPFSDLVFWLAVLPLVFGPLVCIGQLALLVNTRPLSADTASLIQVDYLPWPYDLIPKINLPELIEDVVRDEIAAGDAEPTAPVVTGTYWVIPTPTATEPAPPPTAEPELPTSTPTEPRQATATRTPTNEITATRRPTRTLTATASASPSPTASATFTRTPTFTPTSTFTRTPTRTATPAPSRTPTRPPRPSRTPSPTATIKAPPTSTLTPTRAAVTDTPVPVETTAVPTTVVPTTAVPTTAVPTTPPPPPYIPVMPIAENEGESTAVEGGCRASFGYFNENPQAVNIPEGARNHLNVDTQAIDPGLPTVFSAGPRVNGAFTVVWNVPGPIIWALDGRQAEARWCNP